MPRKEQGWITFQTSEEERKILEEFCQQSQRTKTEILREMVRTLNKHPTPVLTTEDSVTKSGKNRKKPLEEEQKLEDSSNFSDEVQLTTQKKALKVSSRNLLKGVITQIVPGAVNCEVTMEIVHRVKLTSVITQVSAEELELAIGEEAYAVIKSTDIAIAIE
ncbi:TOBE domain-containing protein [Calothrix sp. PCC 6303]|uniref:TOBE domain-containing protein n=1 Tax=Calothrix sp. PCC 6303 TaxID=1170562 RepID=UPI0002A02B79|nr:molybdopterin-binding protein [Calothrix sp. PCC 6303]AFY99735.1 molybdenum-pterin binding protein [Calothrix sp. PCC 6303]